MHFRGEFSRARLVDGAFAPALRCCEELPWSRDEDVRDEEECNHQLYGYPLIRSIQTYGCPYIRETFLEDNVA